MVRLPTLGALVLAIALSHAQAIHAAEWWVDQAAETSGDGSMEKPFLDIQQAVKAAAPGDTITVKAGVYHQSVALTKGGTESNPTTLRAAEGHRVILSGYSPITGWKETAPGTGIYTTTVDWQVRDLFVGDVPQRVAMALHDLAAWMSVQAVDADKGTITLGTSLAKSPGATDIAKDPAGLCVFYFVKKGNYFMTLPVQQFDLATGTLTVDGKFLRQAGDGDRLMLCNHAALISLPGQWACKRLDNNHTQLTFKPADTKQLEITQARRETRRILNIGAGNKRVSYFRVEGIEVAGSLGSGIEAGQADHVQIIRCITYNNDRNGITTRNCTNVNIANCIAFANNTGIMIMSTQHALIENNEVFANYVDGLNCAGDVNGRGTEPISDDITIRANYVHHHLLLGHPDNCQLYRGITNIRYENNLLLLSGQGLMTEEVDGGSLNGNIIFGTDARLIIFGHGNSNDWKVTNNTLGFGGYGAIGMTGKDYQIHRNILINNAIDKVETGDSDYNLFFNANPDAYILRSTKPKWTVYKDVASFADQTGQNQHSLRADPMLANIPVSQSLLADPVNSTADTIHIRAGEGASPFAIGDIIEINGDAVARTVTATGDKTVTFTPALPSRPWREAVIWNWGKRTDFQLDFTPAPDSPARTLGPDKTPVGSYINTKAYMAGDFNADGTRDLPTLADELKPAIPQYNNPVIILTVP